ncbi:MAG: type VI secretion system contractile sheath large subunit, partial [Verrucomicrobiota bacterium]
MKDRAGFNLNVQWEGRPVSGPGDSVGRRRLQILILAALGGTQSTGVAHPIIDPDTAQLFSTLEPACHLPEDGGTYILTSMDDFCPDAILSRIPALFGMTKLLSDLDHPQHVAAATDILTRQLELTPSPEPEANARPPEDEGVEAESLMAGLMDGPVRSGGVLSRSSSHSMIDRMVSDAVEGHRRHPEQASTARARQAGRNRLSDHLRRIIRSPGFRSLESSWRGIQFLIDRLDFDPDDFALHVIDLPREELEILLEEQDVSSHPLFLSLQGKALEEPGGYPWDIVCCLYSPAGNARLLKGLSRVFPSTGPLFIAGTGFPETEAGASNPPFETRPHCRLLLATPRVILRYPYGKATNEIDTFPFEEITPASFKHEDLLWGSGALAATRAAAGMRLGETADTALTLEDLPMVIRPGNGPSPSLTPCAEQCTPYPDVERLMAKGLTVLLSVRDRNIIRIAGLQ